MSSGKDNSNKTPLIEVPTHVPSAAPSSSSSTATTAPRTTNDTSDSANNSNNSKIAVPDHFAAPSAPTTGYHRVTDAGAPPPPPGGGGSIDVPPPAYGSEAAPSLVNLTRVRLQFGGVLILGVILCLVLNYHGITWLFKWEIEKEMALNCAIGDAGDALSDCLGAQGVYRVSFTLFVFFLVHYIMSHRQNLCLEPTSRIEFNHSYIVWKLGGAVGFLALCFVIPNSFFVFFAWLSFVLSILFLIGQLLVLIEFAYSWAEDWSQREDQRYPRALLACTILMVIGAIVIISLGFKFYGASSECGGNQAALTLTLIAGIFYLVLSVHIGKGTIVPAAVVFIYTAWTCFSALSSDSPPECQQFQVTGIGQLVFSAVFTAASLVVSTLSAATSRDAFNTTDMEETGVEADALLLQHFHLMMMLASSYLSMLITNWTIVGDSSMASIYGNRNQASYAAKLGSDGLCVVLFIITLAAPLICKNREF